MSSASLHPRNRHQIIDGEAYDFNKLTATNPALSPYVRDNGYGKLSIDFFDPKAVKELNRSLLLTYYQLSHWDIPSQNLCPPVPGRADYIHHLADLLASSNNGVIPTGKNHDGLDIGTGANLIYPIIGSYEYQWRFVATDCELSSVKCAKELIKANSRLQKQVKIKHQANPDSIFEGMISAQDRFAFTMCNPPFHASAKQAQQGTNRKLKNLTKGSKNVAKLNFSGQSNELWCPGGEAEFIAKMIRESVLYADQVLWFTSLVSSKKNLSSIESELNKVQPAISKIINMGQGNKVSRFIAWSFYPDNKQDWFNPA